MNNQMVDRVLTKVGTNFKSENERILAIIKAVVCECANVQEGQYEQVCTLDTFGLDLMDFEEYFHEELMASKN